MEITTYRRANSRERRPNSHQRGYDARWRRARILHLQKHPLCVMCEQQGRITPATVVDHIKPHQGDKRLFWDRTNWQSLCKQHHDSAKKIEEHAGIAPGCNRAGLPLSPKHPWNS